MGENDRPRQLTNDPRYSDEEPVDGGSRAEIVLAAVPAGWTQTITVVQPEAAGVELIGPQSPEFMTYLEGAISPEVVEQLRSWLPFAVVLRNNSSQPLVAYHVKWALDPPRRGGWGYGEVSGMGLDRYLNPGKAIVLMMAFNLTDTPRPDRLASIQRQGASMLSALQLAKAPAVFLDSAIFASGQSLVPIRRGTLHTTQNRLTHGARWTRKFSLSCRPANPGTP